MFEIFAAIMIQQHTMPLEITFAKYWFIKKAHAVKVTSMSTILTEIFYSYTSILCHSSENRLDID